MSLVLLVSRVLGNAIGKNYVRHCWLYEFRLSHTAADAHRNFRSVLGEDGACERTCRYCFEKLNQNGQEFRNEAEVKSAIKAFLDALHLSFFITTFFSLVKRWKYVVESAGSCCPDKLEE